MSDKIRAALDAVTVRVFAYQPKDKGKWAEAVKAKSAKDQDDDRKRAIATTGDLNVVSSRGFIRIARARAAREGAPHRAQVAGDWQGRCHDRAARRD